MTESKVKAEITTVSIGLIQFEGLMLPDGTFGIAVPQICNLFSFDTNQGSRQIKTILGKNVLFDKWKTSLNSKAVNVLSLKDFERLIWKLNKKGNKIAEDVAEALFGLTLQQLFCDAFEIKFDKEDRQAWLTARMEGITVRNNLTVAIADYLSVYRDKLSINEHKFVYVHCTNAVYKLVFGRTAKQLKEDWQCDNPRDVMQRSELKLVEYVEHTAASVINSGKGSIKPYDATIKACSMLEAIGAVSKVNR